MGVSWGGVGTSWGALAALGGPPGERLGCSWNVARFCGFSWGPLVANFENLCREEGEHGTQMLEKGLPNRAVPLRLAKNHLKHKK